MMRLLAAIDAEEHDHEQEEDDDRTGVDDHLYRREELCIFLDEQHLRCRTVS